MIWDDPGDCVHEWGDENNKRIVTPRPERENWDNTDEYAGGKPRTGGVATIDISQGQFCRRCNTWRGSFGLEPTPELFISHMVQIFREVWRVLRSDGCVFLNLGDSYSGSGGEHRHDKGQSGLTSNRDKVGYVPPNRDPKLKPKDLCGIPWRVALALQADGWYLRSAMPWVKRSAMPESCTDRPASALEYMFLLTKNSRYYFDMESIRKEPQRVARVGWKDKDLQDHSCDPRLEKQGSYKDWRKYCPTGDVSSRNFRNTDLFYQSIQPPHGAVFAGDELVGLDVNPQAQKAAHFATFPEKLVEPCILAGTSAMGCCPECGAGWIRVVEKIVPGTRTCESDYPHTHSLSTKKYKHGETGPESKTIGWRPGCDCPGLDGNHPGSDCADDNNWQKILCTILDPFFGSGTVGIVAHKHGRKFVGIELSTDYLDTIAIPRIERATQQRKLF